MVFTMIKFQTNHKHGRHSQIIMIKEKKVKTVEIHWLGGDKKEIFEDSESNFYYKVFEGTSISTAQGKY